MTDDFYQILGMMDMTPPEDPTERLRLYDAGLIYSDPNDGIGPTEYGWQYVFRLSEDEWQQANMSIASDDDSKAHEIMEPHVKDLLELFDEIGTNNLYKAMMAMLNGPSASEAEEFLARSVEKLEWLFKHDLIRLEGNKVTVSIKGYAALRNMKQSDVECDNPNGFTFDQVISLFTDEKTKKKLQANPNYLIDVLYENITDDQAWEGEDMWRFGGDK